MTATRNKSRLFSGEKTNKGIDIGVQNQSRNAVQQIR